MNILITGAAGFIGSHLVRELEKNHNIIRVLSSAPKIPRDKDIIVDLEQTGSVEKILKSLSSESKIDILLNTASKLSSSENKNDVKTLIGNILITENVAKIAVLLCPDKLINFSSTSIYPNISGIYNEKSLPAPQFNTDCIYGLSKFCSEAMFDFLLRDASVDIIHLRISQVHGNGMREDRIIPVMLKELRKHNSITVYGGGVRMSNFINVKIVVEKINILMKHKVTGIFNLGEINLSYFKLAESLIKKNGNNTSKILKISNGLKAKFLIDTTKLNKVLDSCNSKN
jgi:UDP-glucose 4-epimerase